MPSCFTVSRSFSHVIYLTNLDTVYLPTYLHRFQAFIFLKRHLPRGHSISCLTHDLEQTINKPLTGTRQHVTTCTKTWDYKSGIYLSKQGENIPVFKCNIYLDSLLLLFDGLWKFDVWCSPNIWYGKRKISSCVFPNKNVEATRDSLYHGVVCLGLYVS